MSTGEFQLDEKTWSVSTIGHGAYILFRSMDKDDKNEQTHVLRTTKNNKTFVRFCFAHQACLYKQSFLFVKLVWSISQMLLVEMTLNLSSKTAAKRS
jgi:hypothetical protein